MSFTEFLMEEKTPHPKVYGRTVQTHTPPYPLKSRCVVVEVLSVDDILSDMDFSGVEQHIMSSIDTCITAAARHALFHLMYGAGGHTVSSRVPSYSRTELRGVHRGIHGPFIC